MKIIKSDETECDDLKEIENKLKSEYYKHLFNLKYVNFKNKTFYI